MPDERKPPRLIPVLDVMNGEVVRAVGGRRDEYQPIACPQYPSGNMYRAWELATDLIERARATELYVADLDAIARKVHSSHTTRLLAKACRVPIWLDAGIGPGQRVADLPSYSHVWPVVGSETCSGPDELRDALKGAAERPLAFSIDLKAGQLLGNWANWGLDGPHDVLRLARRVVEMGVTTLIVLDLARVGSGSGAGTEPLLRAIRNEFPDIDLIAGGGVRTWDDVERLGEAGATGVLVASALHDGTLTLPRPTW